VPLYAYSATDVTRFLVIHRRVLPANGYFLRRVTDGARTRDLLSATIRCRPLQRILVCPAIGLIYEVIGDFREEACPLRISLYQPGCSTVAVNNTLPHGDPEPVPGTRRLMVRALSGPGLCGNPHTSIHERYEVPGPNPVAGSAAAILAR
jgi:hypothetical protein